MDDNNKVKLNKFYQLISEDQNIYSDEFSDAFNSIIEAKEKKEINEIEFNFLVKILLTKTIKEETKDIMRWNKVARNSKDTTSFFINVSSKEKRYA